jgi:hypothetical protein
MRLTSVLACAGLLCMILLLGCSKPAATGDAGPPAIAPGMTAKGGRVPANMPPRINPGAPPPKKAD